MRATSPTQTPASEPAPSPSIAEKRWKIVDTSQAAILSLTHSLDLDEMTARLLINRGFSTPDAASRFLSPSLSQLHDPFLLPDMHAAVARVRLALAERHRILVFGDDDVDGLTSSCVVYLLLRQLGAKVQIFIPRRSHDGHGFSFQSLQNALAIHPCDLLITTDCASSAFDELSWLRSQGTDAIIIDHHSLEPPLPPAVAIINPQRPENRYPFPKMAAVGVAFNFALALTENLRSLGIFNHFPAPHLEDLLDLVCLGTISDLVPLLDVNRVFVRLGLDTIQRRRRAGLAALLERTIPNTLLPITERTISHRIAPRLNAAGRVGDVNDCIALLTTNGYATAQAMARRLDEYNSNRQAAEAALLDEAISQARLQIETNRNILVLYQENWTQGVLGIVASRVLERFQRPTILIAASTEGRVRGSARSPEGVDILDYIRRCEDLLDTFGGHNMAAGLSLKAEHITALRHDIEQAFLNNLHTHHNGLLPTTELSIDAEASLPFFRLAFVRNLERLAPFGAGNQEPTFLLKRLQPLRTRVVGRNHLRLKLRNTQQITFDVTGFAMGHVPINRNAELDIVLSPRVQERDNRTVELRMVAFRNHASES